MSVCVSLDGCLGECVYVSLDGCLGGVLLSVLGLGLTGLGTF